MVRTFRPTIKQRLSPLASLVVLFGFQAVTNGVAPGALVVTAGAATAALLIVVLSSRQGVTVTEDGLSVRGYRRRLIPWSDIGDIRIDPQWGARRIVVCKGIDRIHLRAPITGVLQRDPDFDGKYAEIREWWLTRRGPEWRSPEPAPVPRGR